MELNDYLRILRAHWLGVLLIVVACVGAAEVYNLTQDKVYAANASGFVSTGGNQDPALGSVSDTLAKSRATSYVDLAKSRATANAVIDDLGLEDSPGSLIGRISVEQPPDTVLIKISAEGNTPNSAQELADAWVAALADQVAEIEDPQDRNRPGTLRLIPVEAAELPTAPISPNVPRNLLLGLALGLLLGLAYALVRSRLDRRLRSAAEVEQRFDVNVLGSIPLTQDLNVEKEHRARIAIEQMRDARTGSGPGEAFRKLRTNLRFMNVDHPPRVIVVTSPESGDGKSTVAGNLAATIGMAEQPVILVDADLRRPTVATSFGLVEGAGLTDVLTGEATVDDVLQTVADVPQLKVLAAGTTPPNPSELLGSQTMRHLLQELAERATVIVDTPPLLPVTDAAVVTAVADGAFVVVSAGKSLDTDLEAALNHLRVANARCLGVIFNRVSRKTTEGGYYQNYYGQSAAKSEKKADKKSEPAVGARRK